MLLTTLKEPCSKKMLVYVVKRRIVKCLKILLPGQFTVMVCKKKNRGKRKNKASGKEKESGRGRV